MTQPIPGGVDCDLHPAVPHLTSLLPYLSDYWRDHVTTRGACDRPRVAILSAEFPDHVAAGLAAVEGQARLQPRPDMQAQALDKYRERLMASLQSAVRRADGVQRGHGGRVLPRAQRLAGEGVARQGCAAARLDRHSGAERREDRWRRSSAAPRTSASCRVLMLVMGDSAARQARPIGRSTPRPNGSNLPIGIHAGSNYHNPADLDRLGLLPHRGLCRAGAGVPDPADQPDRRRRVRASIRANLKMVMLESGVHLAAVLSVAAA